MPYIYASYITLRYVAHFCVALTILRPRYAPFCYARKFCWRVCQTLQSNSVFVSS